ncbi:GDP-mannose-dependent alpha-mannosyltransferase [Anoxybacillus thermarum]|uniref:GDP-mannose-dependent alpha-mannosyltransferase n=1 Tax=Anoxybacillus thermarum TaxID=404937 RepID=A0A0D0RZB7_9BACL|nr:glycosyltransferase family 1 protein [Anoxybacillus thermarum]KIQ93996.1 GDP-mannose-dependent alpha-mannosyltransferase [Anoxybacillus thermarum]
MKVALFTDTFAPEVNGVARTLKRWVDFLESRGIDFRVFAPETQTDDFSTNYIYHFKSFRFFLYPECRLAIPNMMTIRQQLEQFQPTLIHIATPFNIGLCGLHYAKKMNIPFVASYHTHFDQYLHYYNLDFLSHWFWRYTHWFHRSAEKIFVPSEETLNHLQQRGFTNLHIWSRGVDCSTFYPRENNESFRKTYHITERHIVLYVGRLAREKNVDILIELAKQMSPSIRWVIVGDGPLKEHLKQQAPKNVTFTGFLNGEALAEAYAAADIFAFPSPTETFGNVVLESFASGTPVVCANRGGVTTIVTEQQTGLLRPPDDLNAWKEAIEYLLKDEQKRKQMGKCAREYAKTKDWNNIFIELLSHYEQVAHKRFSHYA